MEWIKNSRETVFHLKDGDLHVTIHKIKGLEGWFLTCKKLLISDYSLSAMTFDDAVLETQKIVMEKADALYKSACEFVAKPYWKNEFSNY